MQAFFIGFGLTISLIASIGLQNLFVIRQGLSNQHPYFSALSCFFCDIIMISLGVFALHSATRYIKSLEHLMIYAGILFLLIYGLHAFFATFKKMENVNSTKSASVHKSSRRKIFLVAIAFSFLNPQAYIDTFVILGGRATHFHSLIDTELFTLGCLLASLVWFVTLAHSAKLGSRWFNKTIAWRLLSLFSGLLMCYCAFILLQML